MKKSILAISIAAAFCSVANADLPPAAHLSIDQGVKFQTTYAVAGKTGATTITNDFTQGSWFSMDADSNGTVSVGEINPIGGDNGLTVDGLTTQAASGSHAGLPGCTFDGSACSVGATPDDPNTTTIDESAPGFDFVEAGDIDNPWQFFSNTGMHNTTSPISSVNDDGAGNVELDFSGWNVTWNSIPSIPMGGDGSLDATNTTIALMTCYASGSYNAVFPFDLTLGAQTDCTAGAFYVLDHKATVPAGDASGFGGVPYVVHLEGVITDTNLAPIATSDPLAAAVAPFGNVLIDLAGNVSDPDANGIDNTSFLITYTGSRSPVPTIVDDGAGSITYTDNDGSDTGVGTPDTFTYTVADVLGKVSATFSVEVGVVAGNIPPIAQGFSETTNKEQAIVADVIANVTDNDGTVDATSVQTQNAVNGSVTNIDSVTGHVTFVPAATFIGTASFEYQVKDDSGDFSNFATVTVEVNDPPFADDDVANVPRNSAGVLINVPDNDTDSDGTIDNTTVAIVSDVSNGTTSIDPTSGVITYTPNMGYLGADSFTYTIMDNVGAVSNVATVPISVNNSLPVANNDTGAVDVTLAASVDIDVVDNDTDSDGTIDTATVSIIVDAANGATSINGAGVVTYTPDVGFIGSDSFTYTVNDDSGDTSNIATAAIIVSDPDVVGLEDNLYLSVNQGTTTGLTTSEPADGNGSWFHMEVDPGTLTFTALSGFNGMQIGPGNMQLANVATPNIDSPWKFFGPLGVHQTTSDVLKLTDDGAGKVTLDLSGWNVSWNSIPSIRLNTRAHTAGFIDGVAQMTCLVDCTLGDTYILEYSATVPVGDPSNFGNVKYFVHLEGTISAGVPVYGGGDANAPVDITEISATDENGMVVVVLPGSTADSVGNTAGISLTPGDIGVTDPQFNPNDGQQCIGGCIDFVITGVTTNYVDLVFKLNEALPTGTIYRKLMNGVWQNFDQSSGDQIGSALSVGGACQQPEGIFTSGLRAGNDCIFMRIFDNGPNDADSTVGTIADPSGALLAGSPNTPAGSSDGCSISKTPVKFIQRADWLIVFGFIAMMGLVSYRRRSENS